MAGADRGAGDGGAPIGGGAEGSARLTALTGLACAATPAMTPLQRMRGLQAVAARLESRRQRRRGRLWLAALAMGLAGAGAAAAVWIGARAGLRRPPPAEPASIAYRIDGGEMGTGGYLRSFGGGGVALRFAEGTELRLRAGARGRLGNVDGRGARFAIEQGAADVSVAARPGAKWLIDAGPFLITVHGTVFTAAWDGVAERLDIQMRNGLVSVTGPVADGVIAVRGGQRLTVNVPRKEVLLRPIDRTEPSDQAGLDDPASPQGRAGPEAAEGTPAVTPQALSAIDGRAPPAGGVTARRSERSAPPASGSWTIALASGRLDEILRQAERRGLERTLSEASSDDLAALADAARYRRRDGIARRALLAQRERFPRSSRAHEAAFLLGRLSESRGDGEREDDPRGDDARALAWYDRYLSEVPLGAYASEALGRKMTATEKRLGMAAAREVAREYLRRFPRGTYAGAARALGAAP